MKAFLLSILAALFSFGIMAQCNCGLLPPPGNEETVIYADNLAEVQQAIAYANGKTTIYLNPGTYPVNPSDFINVYKPDITIRSSSGNRDDVIIQGEGMAAGGGVGHGIFVDADNITVADLTVRDVQNHAFFVNPGADSCLFHNVRGLDTGEQIFKASGDHSLPPKIHGIIECSLFEYTSTLDDGDDGYYTQGIDLLNCHNWIIRDNVIRNIKHNPSLTSTLAGPAILAWYQSTNTIVERNRIIECDFGISFGNSAQGMISHTGGIIKNNFILGYASSDFGIGLAYAPDAKVINNTIYSPGGWPYAIEARFAETIDCEIMNNFSDEDIWYNRDGASCKLTTNCSTATAADFVNISKGDLHLSSTAVYAINTGSTTPDRTQDIDCQDIIYLPDVGADEFDPTYTAVGNTLYNPEKEIAIYPTITKGLITIDASYIRRIIIMDVSGQIHKILAGHWEKGTSLDIGQQAKGIYFVNVFTESGILVEKVILFNE
jgi:hypothetical protein